MIHPESTRIRHFLAITDFYIRIGKPANFVVEPDVGPDYRPDLYVELNQEPVLVEVQRSHIAHRTMQQKVDGFVKSHKDGYHQARKLWIASDEHYKVDWPSGFEVSQIPLTVDI